MKNIKTEWDFTSMYTGINDLKIDKDVKKICALFVTFSKKYKDLKFIKNSKSLKDALDEYDLLTKKTSPISLWYLGLQQSINSLDTNIQARITKLSDEYTKAYKEILFFGLALSQMDKKLQEKYLRDKTLKKYEYDLKSSFLVGKYMLSEKEEKILTDKSSVAHGAWEELGERDRNSKSVKFKNKIISLSEAMSIKSDLPRNERRTLHTTVMEKYKELSFVAEAEMNAVIQNKKIDDELRGFTKPYESTIIGYQNDIKSIENLVNTVTKHNHISHRFFELKAKILNKIENGKIGEKLTMADLATGITTSKINNKKIEFDEACKLVRNSFKELGQEYSDIFDSYLENGQIDVYPKMGKRTGAFCSPMGEAKTYVLLNYGKKMNDVSTMAHEMGHAIHSDLSKTQPPIYQNYTISVAEVASTFFENVLFDNLLEIASIDEKKDLLINKVQDNIFTVFAQIAYFEYEKKIHKAVKEKGFVSKEEFASLFADCRRSYVGDAIDVVENDGYGYVYISHFRYFFYVYSYAYGQLIANALYAEYKKDHSFIKKIKTFLSAGGSASPEDIFKSIGIDTSKPDFFKKGIEKIEKDLVKCERMFE
jgi:oligoendopeptidase F